MRFMMLVIPKGYATAPTNDRPTAEMVGKMAKFNEELRKSGALLSLDGLEAQAAGQRVSFSSGKATVKDGPFTEAKEAVGGYWIIQAKSREEASAWATRAPPGLRR